jgi:hypothetical protein
VNKFEAGQKCLIYGIKSKVFGEVSAGILVYVSQGAKLKGNTKMYAKRGMKKIELAQDNKRRKCVMCICLQ